MRDAIGGCFELELLHHNGFLHDDGILLNTGRNALEYVLRSLPEIRHIWIPYYTCSAVLEPIEKLGIPYSFYHIDRNFEIKDSLLPAYGEYLIYTNYFGIKDDYVGRLAEQYGHQLIVDNAQAWFADPIPGISTIYSPRKYVGVPDGGIAYCPYGTGIAQIEQDQSFTRCSHLLKRLDLSAEEGYLDFKDNESLLEGQTIRRMSSLTRALLSSIDFEMIKAIRRRNFVLCDGLLAGENRLTLPDMDSYQCPMVYPYWTNNESTRKKLLENRVYTATYWPNVEEWLNEGVLEHELMKYMIPIPIDQRYTIEELNSMISVIK